MDSRKIVFRETAIIAVGVIICTAVMLGIFALIGKFDRSVVLGGIFGLTVTVCCFAGLDGGGYILVNASPVITSLVCIIKGVAAGWCSGLAAKALKNKKPYRAIMLAAIAAPVVNTGLFIAAMLIFFRDILAVWAGGTDVVTYIITGLVGVNFIIEFVINVVMAPSLLRVTKAIKKM